MVKFATDVKISPREETTSSTQPSQLNSSLKTGNLTKPSLKVGTFSTNNNTDTSSSSQPRTSSNSKGKTSFESPKVKTMARDGTLELKGTTLDQLSKDDDKTLILQKEKESGRVGARSTSLK